MAVVKMPKDMPPIRIPMSLESEEWLKIVYLKGKGYSHEEALRLVEKLASGEIRDITTIPNK
jgi:hypothetical protein